MTKSLPKLEFQTTKAFHRYTSLDSIKFWCVCRICFIRRRKSEKQSEQKHSFIIYIQSKQRSFTCSLFYYIYNILTVSLVDLMFSFFFSSFPFSDNAEAFYWCIETLVLLQNLNLIHMCMSVCVCVWELDQNMKMRKNTKLKKTFRERKKEMSEKNNKNINSMMMSSSFSYYIFLYNVSVCMCVYFVFNSVCIICKRKFFFFLYI